MISAVFVGLVARVLTALSGVLVLPILLATINVDDLGLWITATATASMLSFDFGVGQNLLPQLTRDLHAARSSSAAASIQLLMRRATGLWAIAGGGILAGMITLAIQPRLILVAGGATVILLTQISSVPSRLLLAAAGRQTTINGMNGLWSILRMIGVLAVARPGGSIAYVILLDCILALSSVTLLRLLDAQIGVVPSSTRVQLKSVLWASRSQTLVATAGMTILQSDTLILAAMIGPSSAAYYTACYRVYALLRELLNVAAVPTTVLASRGCDVAAIWIRVTRPLALGTCILIPPAIALTPLLLGHFGVPLEPYREVLIVLCIGLAFNAWHIPGIAILADLPELSSIAKLHAGWAIANLAIGLCLTPLIGVLAVSLGTALPPLILEHRYLKTIALAVGTQTHRLFSGTASILSLFAVALALALWVAYQQGIHVYIAAALAWAIFTSATARGLVANFRTRRVPL